MLCWLLCPIRCGSPPGSLTSDSESWQKCPEKVLHQSLGEEEGNDGSSSVTSTSSEPSYKNHDTDSEDFVINQILRSINMNIEPGENHLNPPLGNGCVSGHTFPPGHNGLTRGDCAELAGIESVFYCDEGCFVIDQARRGCGHTNINMQTENC